MPVQRQRSGAFRARSSGDVMLRPAPTCCALRGVVLQRAAKPQAWVPLAPLARASYACGRGTRCPFRGPATGADALPAEVSELASQQAPLPAQPPMSVGISAPSEAGPRPCRRFRIGHKFPAWYLCATGSPWRGLSCESVTPHASERMCAYHASRASYDCRAVDRKRHGSMASHMVPQLSLPVVAKLRFVPGLPPMGPAVNSPGRSPIAQGEPSHRAPPLHPQKDAPRRRRSRSDGVGTRAGFRLMSGLGRQKPARALETDQEAHRALGGGFGVGR